MLHETGFLPASEPITALNDQVAGFAPQEILDFALRRALLGRIALVSSFGAESIVLLHMVSRVDPALPILFLDTQMLFKETLAYQTDVASQLGLSDVRHIKPVAAEVSEIDPHGALNQRDKNTCCDLRKTRPLQTALNGFDAWITGRKRFQSASRATLEVFESDGDQRLKVNPLAHWQPKDLHRYITAQDLPRHPLVARGFPSVGCAPCTSAVETGEDPRAGRWRGSEKTECGIHFPEQELVPTPSIGEPTTWQ